MAKFPENQFGCSQGICWAAHVAIMPGIEPVEGAARMRASMQINDIWLIRGVFTLRDGWTEQSAIDHLRDTNGLCVEWVDSESDARAMAMKYVEE